MSNGVSTSTLFASSSPNLISVIANTFCLTGDSCISAWPGGSGSSFGQAWELYGSGSYLAPTTTKGIIVSASSTISELNAGSLNVSGTGTSTFDGNLWVKGNAQVDGNFFAPVSLQVSGFTQGSALFVGPSGTIAQNNSQFFWDNANNRLGIGTTSPSQTLS